MGGRLEPTWPPPRASATASAPHPRPRRASRGSLGPTCSAAACGEVPAGPSVHPGPRPRCAGARRGRPSRSYSAPRIQRPPRSPCGSGRAGSGRASGDLDAGAPARLILPPRVTPSTVRRRVMLTLATIGRGLASRRSCLASSLDSGAMRGLVGTASSRGADRSVRLGLLVDPASSPRAGWLIRSVRHLDLARRFRCPECSPTAPCPAPALVARDGRGVRRGAAPDRGHASRGHHQPLQHRDAADALISG